MKGLLVIVGTEPTETKRERDKGFYASLHWHWVSLGLTLNDDVITGVHNVVLHRLLHNSRRLFHWGRRKKISLD